MEKELRNIYQEVADTINQMIPEEWREFYFYAQISDTGGSTFFYYNTPKNPNEFQYSLEIPFYFSVDRDTFTEMKRNLYDLSKKMRENFESHGQDLWYSFTMKLEQTGKFKIHFDYTDWFKTNYDLENLFDIWKYKYLGIVPDHPNDQKVIEEYLEEYPDNPI